MSETANPAPAPALQHRATLDAMLAQDAMLLGRRMRTAKQRPISGKSARLRQEKCIRAFLSEASLRKIT